MNAPANMLHVHPLKKDGHIFGRRLQPGETLEAGDKYANPSGTWCLVPKTEIGKSVREGSWTVFVRPKG